MAGNGQEIPTFTAFGDNFQQQDERYSDDPFSSYNASKKTDDDPFENYNAKKSQLASSTTSDRPNITISVPIRKAQETKPAKMRRVTRSSSRERDDLRIEVKPYRDRDRSYHSDRSQDKRNDRYHSESRRSPDRGRRHDRRHGDRRHDDRRYNDRRDDRRRSRDNHKRLPYREANNEASADQPKPKLDHNDFRIVPAFRQQQEQAPRAPPPPPPPAPLPEHRQYGRGFRGESYRDNLPRGPHDVERRPQLEQYPHWNRPELHPMTDRNAWDQQLPPPPSQFDRPPQHLLERPHQQPVLESPHQQPAIERPHQQPALERPRHQPTLERPRHQPALESPRHQPALERPRHQHTLERLGPGPPSDVHRPPPSVPFDSRSHRPPYHDMAGPPIYQGASAVRPPHPEYRLQPPHPSDRPQPYPFWERDRPEPPGPSHRNALHQHPPRDRFGPLPYNNQDYCQGPPPEKVPPISEIAEIMKGLKENASKSLESTKEMITTLLPPKPSSELAKIDETTLPPRLGDSSYTSAAISYKEPSPSKPRPPVKRGPDYANMFSKTAEVYKSNWVKTPEKEDPAKASGSNESEDKDTIIKLSGNLEVDLDDVNESQVNLLAKYLKFRTRGLRVVADNLPLRVKKKSENDDDNSALDTVKSVRKAFNMKPNPIPGTISCDLCRKYNLPPDEYRRHINSDFHCWMDGSWQHKLPGFLPRFSLVWCTICKDFFMITFEGNTLLGHEDRDEHRKNKSVYRLQYDDVPQLKYCLLSELRTTKVKMPTPLKCKYFMPREALESYKAAYSKLCDRNLVID